MDIKSKITEGIVIAAVPAFAYWFAFVYQFGYCKYFEIPPEFIEVNIQGVFICIIGIAAILGYIVVGGGPIFNVVNVTHSIIQRKIKKLFMAFFIMAAGAFISKIPIKEVTIVALALFVVLAFYEFVLPIFLHREKATYIERLEADERVDHQYESVVDALARKMGPSVFILIFQASLVSMFVAFIGAYGASSTTRFIIANGGNKIVVKKYGEQFLLAQFNKSKMCISPSLNLANIDSDLGSFTYEKIGRVEVKADCNDTEVQ